MIASTQNFESALVSAKRNGVIDDGPRYDGVDRCDSGGRSIIQKATGVDGGGRSELPELTSTWRQYLLSVGLMHLDELVISLGHRVIPE